LGKEIQQLARFHLLGLHFDPLENVFP